jgi:FO synthase
MLDAPLNELMSQAAAIRDETSDNIVTFSPKVFLPITKLCRDTCAYCTFAQPSRQGQRTFMLPHEVLQTALDGQAAGCTEALITVGKAHLRSHVTCTSLRNKALCASAVVTLICPCCSHGFDHFCCTGDKPELKYPSAAQQLRDLGFETSMGYIAHICALILKHTSLLPHVNAGVVSKAEAAVLRDVSVSAGLMLESSAPVLLQPGNAHHDCPDKVPAARLQVICDAGELSYHFLSIANTQMFDIP